MMMKSKRVKQKTVEQLHDEIMQLFVGQKMGKTLIVLAETLASVANYMEVSDADVMGLLVGELLAYQQMDKQND
jgi:hypothetical protein